MHRLSPALIVLLLATCGDNRPARDLTVYAAGEHDRLLRAFLDEMPVTYEIADAPAPDRPRAEAGLQIAIAVDLEGCGECYRLDGDDAAVTIRASDRLGLQYGLAHALEAAGVRFLHPWRTYVPKRLRATDRRDFGREIAPERPLRGLHLHTIHPIESYFAFWEPGPESLEEAFTVLDWIVKNRGNYVQWVALDDIIRDGAALEKWRAHTAAILEHARFRGLGTGVGIQLFGSSNLQQGFDLIDFDPGEGDERAAATERLALLLEGLHFDNIFLSFGEFFSEEPARFIEFVDMTYDVLQEIDPDAAMATTVHVGQNEELYVEYEGETVYYYFLVERVNEAITPWVHTVMFYNLFEDAGGAYHHDDFAEHRELLLSRLEDGSPTGYFPETAYWVAFDISVPVYLPLYVRNRWIDLDGIRRAAHERGADDLQQHILFSSGWEWGYWQNDYTALRASHTLPDDWRDLFSDMFAPWGDDGRELAAALADLAEIQKRYLMDERLIAYLSGRDLSIDLGRELEIVSQPDRPSFADIVALDAEGVAAFEADVLAPLNQLAAETDGVRGRIAGLDLPAPWRGEIVDALSVTAARARFAHAVFSAAAAGGTGPVAAAHLTDAGQELAEAEQIVARRHQRLHYPREQLTDLRTTATLYQYGYLHQADKLCYWRRELIELGKLAGADERPIPDCLFR